MYCISTGGNKADRQKPKNNMSRKDFVAVAAAIRSVVDSIPSFDLQNETERGYYNGVKSSAESLARTFADVNPRFDRARFIAACGLDARKQPTTII